MNKAQLIKNNVKTMTNEKDGYDDNVWHLVNSSTKEIWDMASEEMEEFLLDVNKDKNASILRAVMQNLVPFGYE